MSKLPKSYYANEDVIGLSKDLLGKLLVTQINGVRTSGIIVETEAYKGPEDKACHAHLNRFTKRTQIMFAKGGFAYVYLCYGIHHLFNIVTGKEGVPHAILIRGIEPKEGVETMLLRRGMTKLQTRLTAGPGTLSKALGINKSHYGLDLTQNTIWIEDIGESIETENIIASPRVGIDYAEEHTLLPWRFRIKGNKWTSKAK